MDIIAICEPGSSEVDDYLLELEDLTDIVAKNSVKQRSLLVEQAKILIEKCKANCR
jgi:hypothetical protein